MDRLPQGWPARDRSQPRPARRGAGPPRRTARPPGVNRRHLVRVALPPGEAVRHARPFLAPLRASRQVRDGPGAAVRAATISAPAAVRAERGQLAAEEYGRSGACGGVLYTRRHAQVSLSNKGELKAGWDLGRAAACVFFKVGTLMGCRPVTRLRRMYEVSETQPSTCRGNTGVPHLTARSSWRTIRSWSTTGYPATHQRRCSYMSAASVIAQSGQKWYRSAAVRRCL